MPMDLTNGWKCNAMDRDQEPSIHYIRHRHPMINQVLQALISYTMPLY